MFSRCKSSKNTSFDEYLRTPASEVTLRSDCLEHYFWPVSFKTILKQPAFKPEFQTQFGAYAVFTLTLRFLLSLGFLCSLLTVAAEKANACSPWTPCYFLL